MTERLTLEDAAALLRPTDSGHPARPGPAGRLPPRPRRSRTTGRTCRSSAPCSSTSTRCSSSPACTTSAGSSGRPSGSSATRAADVAVRAGRLPPLRPDRSSAIAPAGHGHRGRAARRRRLPAACRSTPAPPSAELHRGRRRPRPAADRRGQRQVPPDLRHRARPPATASTSTRSTCWSRPTAIRSSWPTPSPPTSSGPSPSSPALRAPTAPRCRPASAASPTHVAAAAGRGRRRRLRHPLRDVHHRADAAAPGRQGHQRRKGDLRRLLGHHLRRRHPRALRLARRQRRRCGSCPSTLVNSPEVIARNRQMVTINGALASTSPARSWPTPLRHASSRASAATRTSSPPSGLELEDRSLICLPSTRPWSTATGRVAASSPSSPPAPIVTTPRHQLDVVVTEHGVAELRGRTVRERAVALAAIAHPDFRDHLLAAAEVWPPA